MPRADYQDRVDEGEPLVGSVSFEGKDDYEEAPRTRHFRDPAYAVMFYLHLVGMIVFGVITHQHAKSSEEEDDSQRQFHEAIDQNSNLILANVGIAFGLAMLSAWVWLKLMQNYATVLITFCLWSGVVFMAFMTFVSLALGNLPGFLMFGISALFSGIYAIVVRHRIPFSSAMLAKACSVIRDYPATVGVAFAATFVEAGALFLITYCMDGLARAQLSVYFIILIVFSTYWTQQVISNTVHVTVAGTVATDYFQRGNMPSNPTVKALHRSLTTSFGSICFGSLIVAILQTARWIVEQARSRVQSDERERGNVGLFLILCCLDCIVSILERLVRYFNKYAFIQIAIYGKPFMEASRDTWELFQTSGISALVNDDLTGGVLAFVIFISSLMNGLIAGLISFFLLKTGDSQFAVAAGLVAFVITIFVVSIAMTVIDSSVSTIFVCFAQDPNVLTVTDVDFYHQLTRRQAVLSGASPSSFV